MAFEKIIGMGRMMSGLNCPWFVAGGWAIDLFLGRYTRSHHDLEIAIFRQDQAELQSLLTGWEWTKINPSEGNRTEKWLFGEYLTPPIHEIHASSPDHDPRILEILLNERDNEHWIFRRDSRIRRQLSKTGLLTKDSIPFLCPEIVLLYKAKNPRPVDEADFFHTYQDLDDEAGGWLAEAIRTCYPGHLWLLLLPDNSSI